MSMYLLVVCGFLAVFKIATCSDVLICVSPAPVTSGTSQVSACPNDAVIVATLAEAMARIEDNQTSAEIVLLPGLHLFDVVQLSSHVSYNIHGLYSSNSDQHEVFLQPSSSESGFNLMHGISSGISFSNFAVSANTSGSVFRISESRHVMFDGIYLLDIASHSIPIFITNSLDVRLTNCKFLGSETPAPAKANRRIGLSVVFQDFSLSPLGDSDATMDTALSVLGCHFSNFTAFFPSVAAIATAPLIIKQTMAAIGIHFMGQATTGLKVVVNESTFDDIEVPLFSPVHVMFSNGSSNNSVLVTGNTFTDCIGRAGGAISIDFNNNTIHNVVSIANTNFSDVSALLGGGTVDGRFINASTNKISFESCFFVTNSTEAVFLKGAILLFYSNEPSQSYSYTSNAMLPYHVTVRNCHFNAYKPSDIDGVIVAKHVKILLEDLTAVNNGNSLIQLFGSFLEARGTLTVEHTYSTNGGFVALFDESDMDLADVSRLNLVDNEADQSGGAIYSDASNGQSFVTWTNYFIGMIEKKAPCLFFQMPTLENNTTRFAEDIQFASSSNTPQPDAMISFQSNRALKNGMDISAPSFYRCPQFFSSCKLLREITQTEFVPADNILQHLLNITHIKPVHHLSQCLTVKENLFDHPVHSRVSSDINWLFFESASCSCLKHIPATNDLYWQFRDNCHASRIISTVNATTAAFVNSFDSSFHSADQIQLTIDEPLPPGVMFFVPWSHSWAASFLFESIQEKIQQYVIEPSEILLTPSPGQLFSLSIAGYDQFLRAVNGSVALLSLQPAPAYNQLPLALLRQGHKEYARSDSILFVLNEPIADLAILGLVNTSGSLWITADSIFPDKQMVLQIRFRLAPCQLGYKQSNHSAAEVAAYISTFTTRTASDWYNNYLACQCIESPAINYCDSSGTVVVVARFWAGDVNDRQSWAYKHAFVVNGTQDELLGPGYRRQFAWGRCVLDYCNHRIIDGNWTLNQIDPCRNNRTGVLCSVCENGLCITPFNAECQECSGKQSKIGIFVNVLAVVGGSVLLLVIALVTDISTSTTFNTLLFSYQVTPYLLSVGTEASTFVSRLWKLYSSFCFTDTFDSLDHLAFQFFFPTFLILLVIIMKSCSNTKPFRRLVTAPLKALVVALYVTYVSYITSGMDLLRSSRVYIDGSSDDGDLVLFVNGSIPYSSLHHVALMPVGILILIAAAVLPILAVYFRNHGGAIKPLADIYTSYYNDDYRWWVGVDLGRRYIVALLSVGVAMAPVNDIMFVRQNSLMAAVTVLTVLQVICKPFKDEFSNTFESLILLNMCLLTGLSIMPPSPDLTVSLCILAVWPFCAGAVIVIYQNRQLFFRIFSAFKEKMTRRKNETESMQPLIIGNESSSDDGSEQLEQEGQNQNTDKHET